MPSVCPGLTGDEDEVAVPVAVLGVGVMPCAQPDTDTASISAPRGSNTLSEAGAKAFTLGLEGNRLIRAAFAERGARPV